MKHHLAFGFSPCPNDTFIFFALANGRINLEDYSFNVFLADVEELNRRATNNDLDVTKVSINAVLYLLDEYCLLRSGGAIGRGCGPLLVARESCDIEELRHATVAIPGRMTTAFLLFRLHGEHEGPCLEMPFDQIMPAVARGEVDAGLIIHEGRFTYPSLGLKLVLDLGNWWEKDTGLPLPLGGIIIKRNLGIETARKVEEFIRASLNHAWQNPKEAWPYIQAHAQEMAPDVIQKHIDTFVNDFSLDVGSEGKRAVEHLLRAASGIEHIELPDKPIFWDSSPSK